jgi:hydroxyacylglutathione hydrolase
MSKLYQHYSLYDFANSYLLGDEERKEALIVDPAEFNASLLNHIEGNGYVLKAVLVTHNHLHHTRGLRTLRKIYDAQIFAASSKVLGFPSRVVRDGELFEAAGFEVEAFSVPGHSPDSMIYKIGGILFTGDSLHAGIIGRTLSPFNARALIERLEVGVLKLDDDCLVLPAHGPPSTLGVEKRFNLGFEEGFAQKMRVPNDFFI